MSEPATTAPVAINTTPAAGQLIEHHGKTLTTINEGLAYILIPPETPLATDPLASLKDGPQRASVFYNPIQQYNRDLTVLVIKAFGEDFISKQEAQRNKSQRPRPRRKDKNAIARPDETQVAGAQPKLHHGEAPRQASPEKRKRDAVEDQNLAPSSGKQVVEKRRRLGDDEAQTHRTNILESEVSQPQSNTDATQDPPLFSSMIKDRISTQENVDDSFEDGGIADEDFLLAEQNARQAGMLPGSQCPPNGDNNAGANHSPAQDVDKKKPTRFSILDALSASGLRALRYAKELSFVTSITANDLSPDAVASIKDNIEHNGPPAADLIRVTTGNAVAHMANFMGAVGNKYTVIDLDPYGTAVPFLDTAIQAVADNGLLCVTCTDTAIFNSMGYLEKTFSQYGGLPVKGDFCHEAGVRLILHSIASTAGKYGISIEPLLSLSIDYYARVFVRIRRSAAEVKFLGGKTMIVYNCDSGCGSWTAQPLIRIQEKKAKNGDVNFKFSAAQGPTASPLCDHCGSKCHIAGPMWGGPLHNPAFIDKVLYSANKADTNVYRTIDRIKGQLNTALEETTLYEVPESISTKAKETVVPGEAITSLEYARVPAQIVDKHPFYFDPSSLARTLHCCAPSNAQMQGALRHQGYRCVRSHAKAGSIKTDAPFKVLWHVMKAWIKTQKDYKAPKMGTAGQKIYEKYSASDETTLMGDAEGNDSKMKEVLFDEVLGRQDTGIRGLVRYQVNPRENWGPMARAKGAEKGTRAH